MTESQLAASPCGKLSQPLFGLSGETAAQQALRSIVKGKPDRKAGAQSYRSKGLCPMTAGPPKAALPVPPRVKRDAVQTPLCRPRFPDFVPGVF